MQIGKCPFLLFDFMTGMTHFYKSLFAWRIYFDLTTFVEVRDTCEKY